MSYAMDDVHSDTGCDCNVICSHDIYSSVSPTYIVEGHHWCAECYGEDCPWCE